MEWLAFAIVNSTILLLVDRNGAWRGFRRTVIWSVIGFVVLFAAYAAWDNHQRQQALEQAISNAKTPPLPAGYKLDQ
jgi:hypothetical protein